VSNLAALGHATIANDGSNAQTIVLPCLALPCLASPCRAKPRRA
jgi:hypothetical protein